MLFRIAVKSNQTQICFLYLPILCDYIRKSNVKLKTVISQSSGTLNFEHPKNCTIWTNSLIENNVPKFKQLEFHKSFYKMSAHLTHQLAAENVSCWERCPNRSGPVCLQDRGCAGCITSDPTHPGHSLSDPLPSSRSLRSIQTTTDHHINNFFPLAIRLMNTHIHKNVSPILHTRIHLMSTAHCLGYCTFFFFLSLRLYLYY